MNDRRVKRKQKVEKKRGQLRREYKFLMPATNIFETLNRELELVHKGNYFQEKKHFPLSIFFK